MTNQERLAHCQAVIAALNASILKLAGKTNQSVSFGDQNYNLAEMARFQAQLQVEEAKESRLLRRLSGQPARPSHKVTFRSC